MENAHQHSRLAPARSSLEGSEQPTNSRRSGHTSSRNSTQRTPEHRVEYAAPMIEERSIEELSGSRFGEEERRGAGRHQIMDTTSVGQHKKPWNQMGSGDQGRPVLTEDYSNSETRSAYSERLDSTVIDVSGQSSEGPFSPISHLQINHGDKFKFPETYSPMLNMAAALPSGKNSEEHYTGGEQLLRDDHKPDSAQSDPQNRDEAKYNESGKLRAGGIIRRPVNGENQQRWSGKPAQLSTNGTDQVQHKKDMHKLQIDHAIEMNTIREKHQAEVAKLKEDHHKSVENDRLDRSDLQTAHRNAILVLCDEKTGLQQLIDELRSKLKSAEERNIHLLHERDSKSDDLKIAHQALENTKRDINDTSKKLQSTREEADRLKQSKAECTYQIHKLEQSLTERGKQLAIFEQTQVDERSQHAEAVATLYEKIRTVKADCNEQVDSLIRRQRQETDQLQNTHKAEISRLIQEHNNEIGFYQRDIESVKTQAEKKRQKLEFAHDQQMAQRMDEHEGTVAQMKAELAQVTEEEGKKRQNLTALHDKQRTQIFQEHEQVLSRINEELVEVRQDKELKISRLKEAHAAELAQKDVNYAQGTRQLREDVRRLNAALLTRDDQLYQGELFTTLNLPTRPDEQIRGKFSEIEQMVDGIGRLQWKQEPAVWTSEVLRSVGGNSIDRVLKKAIVQDLVWCLLFNHIFCSPFRVFGAEGRLLEEEWNEHCGQGIHHHISFMLCAQTLTYTRWKLEQRSLLMAGAWR
jgi:hypothetical protein